MKKTVKIFANICTLLAVLLLLAQGCYLFLAHRYDIHYIYDSLFFVINCFILLFAFLGFVPYVKTKRPLIVLAGFLLIFQGSVLFVGMDHQVVVSSSPKETNTFMLRIDKRTGFAAYQRNLYYQWPQVQAFLPKPTLNNRYLAFSTDAEQLAYPVGSAYKIDWPTEEMAVFSYQTQDGGNAQFIRSYSADTAYPVETGLSPAIIGNWQSTDGNSQLKAQGNPYLLTIGDQELTLNPSYQISFSQFASVYTDAQGNALCALILNSSKDKLTIIPADPKQADKSDTLNRLTDPL